MAEESKEKETVRTVKIKLPFPKTVGKAERKGKLLEWAKALVNGGPVNVLDEQHYDNGSTLTVENTYIPPSK